MDLNKETKVVSSAQMKNAYLCLKTGHRSKWFKWIVYLLQVNNWLVQPVGGGLTRNDMQQSAKQTISLLYYGALNEFGLNTKKNPVELNTSGQVRTHSNWQAPFTEIPHINIQSAANQSESGDQFYTQSTLNREGAGGDDINDTFHFPGELRSFFSAVTGMQPRQTHLHSSVESCSKLCRE